MRRKSILGSGFTAGSLFLFLNIVDIWVIFAACCSWLSWFSAIAVWLTLLKSDGAIGLPPPSPKIVAASISVTFGASVASVSEFPSISPGIMNWLIAG